MPQNKTGPGSDARWIAYHIDALILARIKRVMGQLNGSDDLDEVAAITRKLEELEQAIAAITK